MSFSGVVFDGAEIKDQAGCDAGKVADDYYDNPLALTPCRREEYSGKEH